MALIAVFVIIDPFSLVPIYLTLTESYSHEDRRRARMKATLVSEAMLVGFALFGMSIFKLFGITLPAFQIAGGILLLSLGVEQLGANLRRVKDEEEREGLEKDDISVFPLATPLLAGPGAISTVVLLASKCHSWQTLVGLLLAITLTLMISYVLLALAPRLVKILGKTGLNLMTRLMAIILTAVAVQFILNGISGFWQVLKS